MSRPVSRKPSPGALRMRLLHQRRQEGRQRVESPWSWLSIADVKKLAGEAYRIASYDSREIHLEPDLQGPELFCDSLVETFEVLVRGHAQQAGLVMGSWSYVDQVVKLRAAVPVDWQPQYPLFVDPASSQGSGTTQEV